MFCNWFIKSSNSTFLSSFVSTDSTFSFLESSITSIPQLLKSSCTSSLFFFFFKATFSALSLMESILFSQTHFWFSMHWLSMQLGFGRNKLFWKNSFLALYYK